MQEGIKIKSIDINFVISIFYLAINLFIGIFIITQKLSLLEKLLSSPRVIYPLLKLKEPAVSQRQTHDDLVNSDFLTLTS